MRPMNDADARTNMRVAFSMGLEKDVRAAIELNKSKLYPYIAIDRTNQARVNGLVVYTDHIDDFKRAAINSQLKVMFHTIFFYSRNGITLTIDIEEKRPYRYQSLAGFLRSRFHYN